MPVGELAALTAATLWGFTSVFFFSVAARRIGALRVNLLRLPLGWGLLGVTLLVTGLSAGHRRQEPRSCWRSVASIGLSIGDLAYFAAMRRIGPRLAVLLLSLAPLFAAGIGVVLLHEIPGPMAGAGIVLTLGGVFWVVLERRDEGMPAGHHVWGVVLGADLRLLSGVWPRARQVGDGRRPAPVGLVLAAHDRRDRRHLAGRGAGRPRLATSTCAAACAWPGRRWLAER